MTLWLPALNTGSSYRAAFLSLKDALPPAYSCVASIGLGESERAMLDHYTGLRTRRIEVKRSRGLRSAAGAAGRAVSLLAGEGMEEDLGVQAPEHQTQGPFLLVCPY